MLQGIDEFFKGVDAKREEFERDYKPELERRRAERETEKAASRQRELDKLMKDMNVGPGKKPSKKPRRNADEPETVSDAEDADKDDDEIMQDDDDDYSDNPDYDDADDGLKSRYQQALKNTLPEDEDFSFARYVHKAKIG